MLLREGRGPEVAGPGCDAETAATRLSVARKTGFVFDSEATFTDQERANISLVAHYLSLCGAEICGRVERHDLGAQITFLSTAYELAHPCEGTMSSREMLLGLDAMLRDMNIRGIFAPPKQSDKPYTREPLLAIGATTPPLSQRPIALPGQGDSLRGRQRPEAA